jgi:hypothetical protein
VGISIISIYRSDDRGSPVAMLAGLLCLAIVAAQLWQAAMLVALSAYFLIAIRVRILPNRGWYQRGKVPWLFTAFCAAVTPVFLVAWVMFFNPDIKDLVQAVPRLPLPLLVLGAVIFAVLNALGEEMIWRGLFQDRLTLLFGAMAAVAIQGVSFGVLHAHGFPRGVAGVVMAGTWGIMLGWLRVRSGGILAPILAHIVADATIAVIVISMARG